MRNEKLFRADFFMPAYWGTWMQLLVLWLIMWLPRVWVMSIGAWLGDQTRKRNAKRRHIAEVNIRLCFPHLSELEMDQMLIDHFQSYGRGLVDMGLMLMAKKERIEKYSRVVGLENMTGQPDGKRIILITYHTTTLDMCSSSMMADIKLVSMMKREKNPLLNWFLHRARTRYKNAEVFMRDQGLRGIVAGMKQGKTCYLIPDEDFGEGPHSVFAPFFGQPRATLNIVSRLAKAMDAAVIPLICRLEPDTGHYVTTVAPALENFPGEDLEQDVVTMNRAMEALINQAPEQYLWTFRWFKTIGEGQDIYALNTEK